ncbi:hypothetical protein ACSBR1_035456 [Camellia fascicularis]
MKNKYVEVWIEGHDLAFELFSECAQRLAAVSVVALMVVRRRDCIELIISRIGFKSVFHITVKTCIFSNGYQIRFNEEPCSQCNIGYIVPEWVNDNSTLSTIKQIYGSDTLLLTTTIGFPLKPDKIKRLSVKEDNEDPRLNSVSVVSISSETNFVTTKNNDAQSYTLHL